MCESEHKSESQVLWVIAAVFLLLTIGFILNIWGTKKEIVKQSLIDPADITTSTVRNPLTGPVIRHAGFKYNCRECHQNFKTNPDREKTLTAHKNVIMEHGINNTCLNCHHQTQVEFLTDIDKKTVAITKSELLCRKCHGARYRDWMIGIHGKQTGYWDKNLGVAKKETCVACHNPHSPKFKPMKPARGPVRHNFSTDKETGHE